MNLHEHELDYDDYDELKLWIVLYYIVEAERGTLEHIYFCVFI